MTQTVTITSAELDAINELAKFADMYIDMMEPSDEQVQVDAKEIDEAKQTLYNLFVRIGELK